MGSSGFSTLHPSFLSVLCSSWILGTEDHAKFLFLSLTSNLALKMNFQDLFCYFRTRNSSTSRAEDNNGGIMPGGCSNVHSLEGNLPLGQMDLESDSISSAILHNHLMLKRMFHYLDFKDLKSARLVCRDWSREAARHFSHMAPVIRIGTCGLKELSTYLFRHRIHHNCLLSFLQQSRALKPNDENWWTVSDPITWALHHIALQRFYRARNICPSDIFEHLKLTGGLIRKMWLEMVLIDEADTKLLLLVLTNLANLETLELELVRYQIAAFISPILQESSFPAIQTLGLRFHKFTKCTPNSTTTTAALAQLLKVFKNVQRLELSMKGVSRKSDADITCLEAVALLHAENPEYICNLKKLRIALRDIPGSPRPKWRHVETFPNPLVSLECSIEETDQDDLDNFRSTLMHHSATMESLDLSWIPFYWIGNIDIHSKISLPYLPNLTKLNFDSFGTQLDGERLPPGYLDVLSLREIFLEGESMLEKTLPSLTTLSVILFRERGLDIWHHMFPDVDKYGMPLEIKQIKFLTLSISAECEGSEISRFHKIFPKLNYLRHTRREIQTVKKTDIIFLVVFLIGYEYEETWSSTSMDANTLNLKMCGGNPHFELVGG